ncbi:cytochrome P450 4g15-like [Macrosteles quadrilineatus]|uniref:cytochrome P450 4g15-like n=1 Tax=Macrosteles quadrilineatus TaxID=74068 RepID=UPI0023E1D489|nr:cytochrome P450 4g15-like [Macrosteles quadrilineatus]XP_054269205.1 cytochrome P450 4g15-like [Macrosteles quadrilineatus]
MESIVASASEEVPVVSSTAMFFYLLIPTLMLWYVYHRISNRHMYELGNKIPGPPALPVFGNALEFIGASNHRVFQKLYSRSFEYESIARLWVGPRLFVFLTDPRDIELILGSTVHIDKSVEYKFFKPWLGNGLLISTGEKWRAHRKLIAPTFHLNVLKSFLDLFNTNSRDVVQKLRDLNGKEFDCHDYMSECTVEILLETAMGVSKKTQDKSGFEYAMAVMKMCNILHLRQTKVWLRPEFLFQLTKYGKDQVQLLDTIHSLTKKVLKRKKEEHLNTKKSILEKSSLEKLIAQDEEKLKEAKQKASKAPSEAKFSFGQAAGLKDDLDVDDNDVGEKKRSAFLDFMIECAQNGVVLTDDEIKEQVDTIMFEGHDTTAAGSSFFLCVMAARPDIQDKVIQEIDEIFGDSDRPCSFQDTLEMKYLERCIMETLRMFPPVPVIAREIMQDLPLASSDLVVPTHTTVIIGTFKLHRRPDIYPNPDEFNPDNFLPEKSASRHYYSFIPFSAGPRSCVGRKYAMLKLKVILSTIMRDFRVAGGKPMADWKLQADIILKRTDGFNIKLEPRKRVPSSATELTA